MTKRISTKSTLLTSAIALLLCVSMLIGTTFAWFTDSATTVNNKIVAGNLDVNLYYSSDANGWNEVKNDTNIFTDSLWEPGHTEVVYLKVVNEGTLALKYILNVNIAGETGSVNVDGEKFELSDYIEYGIMPVTVAFDSRSAARNAVAQNAMGLKESYAPASQILTPGQEVVVALVVYMTGNVGNEANYAKDAVVPTIDLGINLLATQVEYEGDSFGTDYDANADYVIQEGDSMEMLNQKFDSGLINNGNLTLNGGSIVSNSWGFENNGSAALNGVQIDAGSAADYAAVLGAGSQTTMNDVAIHAKGGAFGIVDGAQAVFNSGSVDMNTTSTSGRYLFYVVGQDSKLTINGGSFDWDRTQNQKRAYIYVGAGATVEINGGTFGKASTRSGYTAGILGEGTVIIRGGTFGFDPAQWLAPGYKTIKNGANWVVVPENVNILVHNAAELQEALNNATGDYVIMLNADITGDVTATQKEGVNLTVEGAGRQFTGTFYIHGQARFQGAETLTLKNINFVTDGTVDFISANSTGSVERYAHNVTVDGCSFTAADGTEAVGLRMRQAYNITVKNSTFTGMYGAMWATGGNGVTVDNVTITGGKNGLSFGTCTGITVENTVIDAIGYGIRADGSGAYDMTVKDCAIAAPQPIIIRKTTGAYKLTVADCTLTAAEDGYQVILTAGDDDEALTAPTGAYELQADGLYIYQG